jgi:hypothetical protein
VNTQNLKIFLWRNKTCGEPLTTATSTSSSLGSLTLFQNSNSTGLNPANSLFTCLLEWSSLLTRTSNLLQIKPNLQCNLLNSLLNLLSLRNLHNPRLNLRNLNFNQHHQPLYNNLLRSCNPLPDQVGCNIKLTNTIYDFARI